jgi:hypothetical protein
MIAGMVGGIFAGGAPAQPVPWRLLRLADAREAAWDGAAKVQTEAQDADGWITLGLRNDSPAADFPAKMAFHTFQILNADGSPADPESLAPGRVIVALIQRDPTAWPGSAAQETVAVGIVDRDGDVAHASAVGLLLGMRTASASTSCTLITGSPTAATTAASTTPRAAASLTISPTQGGAVVTAGLTEAGAIVAGDFSGSVSSATGPRRLVLATGCNSSTNNGPHPVRFRVWYAFLAANEYPWTDPA